MADAEVTRPTPRAVVFSRLIAAPVDLVWELWSDPRHLREWYGPTGFTITTRHFAFEPDGVWEFIMHGPDGIDNPSRIVFRDIEPKSRFTYDNSWAYPDAPLEFTGEVMLTPEGDGTRLVLELVFANEEAMRTAVERYGVLNGGVETFDRLARWAEGGATR